ncbi:MAG: hypothetical protein Fur0032_11380 [Terrimicrobiaceae bacterium]
MKPQSPHRSPGILHVHSGSMGQGQRLGPYEITSLIADEEEAGATAYRVVIGPHEHTAVSYHKIAEELYFVISGKGTAVLDGVDYPLVAGDFLRLPPGVRHGFVTQDESLVMLDIHTPGSRPDRDVYFEGMAPPGFAATPGDAGQ